MSDKQLKKYEQWKNDLRGKLDVKKITSDLIEVTKREANETKISAKILSKIISNYFKVSNHRISKKEIEFLKSHTSDIAKVIPFIATIPTPIPYITISIILKKFGIDIMPSGEALDIPPEHI
jgi:hypothetical protein